MSEPVLSDFIDEQEAPVADATAPAEAESDCDTCNESVMGGFAKHFTGSGEGDMTPWLIALIIILIVAAAYYWYTHYYKKSSTSNTSSASGSVAHSVQLRA